MTLNRKIRWESLGLTLEVRYLYDGDALTGARAEVRRNRNGHLLRLGLGGISGERMRAMFGRMWAVIEREDGPRHLEVAGPVLMELAAFYGVPSPGVS